MLYLNAAAAGFEHRALQAGNQHNAAAAAFRVSCPWPDES